MKIRLDQVHSVRSSRIKEHQLRSKPQIGCLDQELRSELTCEARQRLDAKSRPAPTQTAFWVVTADQPICGATHPASSIADHTLLVWPNPAPLATRISRRCCVSAARCVQNSVCEQRHTDVENRARLRATKHGHSEHSVADESFRKSYLPISGSGGAIDESAFDFAGQ
jgi:hypothetical protein